MEAQRGWTIQRYFLLLESGILSTIARICSGLSYLKWSCSAYTNDRRQISQILQIHFFFRPIWLPCLPATKTIPFWSSRHDRTLRPLELLTEKTTLFLSNRKLYHRIYRRHDSRYRRSRCYQNRHQIQWYHRRIAAVFQSLCFPVTRK